jgi:hypothetical protein
MLGMHVLHLVFLVLTKSYDVGSSLDGNCAKSEHVIASHERDCGCGVASDEPMIGCFDNLWIP